MRAVVTGISALNRVGAGAAASARVWRGDVVESRIGAGVMMLTDVGLFHGAWPGDYEVGGAISSAARTVAASRTGSPLRS